MARDLLPVPVVGILVVARTKLIERSERNFCSVLCLSTLI